MFPKIISARQGQNCVWLSLLLFPSLQMKPYVSYKVPEITQTELTAKDLFNATYAKDVIDKYKRGRLDVDNLTAEDVLNQKLKSWWKSWILRSHAINLSWKRIAKLLFEYLFSLFANNRIFSPRNIIMFWARVTYHFHALTSLTAPHPLNPHQCPTSHWPFSDHHTTQRTNQWLNRGLLLPTCVLVSSVFFFSS